MTYLGTTIGEVDICVNETKIHILVSRVEKRKKKYYDSFLGSDWSLLVKMKINIQGSNISGHLVN